VGFNELIPILVFAGLVAGIFAVLTLISNRNSRAQDRLERISRPASLAELEDPKQKKERFRGVMETAKALSKPLMPQTELERSALKTRATALQAPQIVGGRLSLSRGGA
jgi:tight adherence protein C